MPSATVDLYSYDLDRIDATKLDVERVLSAEEIDRAARFKFAELRRRYTIAHLLLRVVLSSHAKSSPSELIFRAGSHGKPHLVDGPAFNMAHSESTLLIGVADGGRLGVDVERLRDFDSIDALVEKNFSAAECVEWRAAAPEERTDMFLRAWTRKEAFIKAIGKGLSVPLAEFSVSLADTDGNALRDARQVVSDPDRWSVQSVPLRAGIEAAVAWDRPCFDVRVVSESDAPLP
jgi:4'-phosphopantetheinyl transferase